MKCNLTVCRYSQITVENLALLVELNRKPPSTWILPFGLSYLKVGHSKYCVFLLIGVAGPSGTIHFDIETFKAVTFDCSVRRTGHLEQLIK